MSLTLRKIEELAPDQSSLDAAKKLKTRSKWPLRARDDGHLVWGECQGSGSNPYRSVVDTEDLGYKCTCPSRKFPCKHALALMWMFAESEAEFVAETPPAWVNDWLGRRRPRAGAAAKAKASGASMLAAELKDGPQEPEDEASLAAKAERARAAAERAQKLRHTAILAGLDELERWLLDGFGRGLASFQTSMHDACRTLSRRLVDAKAPGLAVQVDQLPSRLLSLPPEARPDAGLEAFAQLHLLASAYRRLDALPPELAADVRSRVGIPIKREAVLADPSSVRVEALWTCFGARTLVQANDLQRVESWLVRPPDGGNAPQFGLLIDHHPSSAGRIVSPFSIGDQLQAELVFYPSASPLRALIQRNQDGSSPGGALPAPRGSIQDFLTEDRSRATRLPWSGIWPVSVGPASLAVDEAGGLHLSDEQGSLPVHERQRAEASPLAGLPLRHALGAWDGSTLTLFCADTQIGRWEAEEVGR